MSRELLSIRDLHAWFGESHVLHGVNMRVNEGEVVSLLGRNGAGRTTTMRAIMGLTGRRAGSIRIGAKAVNRDATSILLQNVDQPRSSDFLRGLIAGHREDSAATLPVCAGKHGHPVIVSGRLRNELMGASDAQLGLDGVLKQHSSEIAEFAADDSCLVDTNTPEEFEAAKRRFGLTPV
jgi:CTP:molybdopterin cytidylyltransferase MocA